MLHLAEPFYGGYLERTASGWDDKWLVFTILVTSHVIPGSTAITTAGLDTTLQEPG